MPAACCGEFHFKIFLNLPDSEFSNRMKNILSGVRYAHFEGLLHSYNLLNRDKTMVVTTHQMRRKILCIRSAGSDVVSEEKRFEMEMSFWTDLLINFV
jgi:hypothetical protein